ncbi:uncharacterized protein FSUBG_7017 [Fusarium subglutinans]|uniref:Uncharacterized protein n=1 Tax=Gibberella subglutinans TaxID=42677 RepID=A0A8H5V0H6_GIBSU|nr:uncharacterized protein FSUBG_7017 [Fusarium subglutinans]KAF5603919.1 hypothetical protein FSUBG_7017 [Fusarium subglutinans]
MVLMPPKSHRETVVQPLTLEEYGGATIQEPGMTHSLQLSTPPQASEAIAPCQPESDPISAPGPYLELMPEAWGDCALQPDVYWWDTMHVRCQATGPSVSTLNAPTAVHLGFHDFGEEICVSELQGDWHLETRDNLSTMGQPSLYSYNNPIKILGHLTPRAQALSNKSREVFENRGSFHKQGDIDLRFPPLLRNDAAFKLVMTWLFNPSEDMNDECSILNSLSTTTDELRNEEVVVELVSCSSKFATTTLSLQEELGSRTNKAASDENVAHHLVTACHALLLDSFGAVLGALQGAADTDRHARRGPCRQDMRISGWQWW